MIGDGPDHDTLQVQIQGYGIQGRVEMLGQRADVEDFQARSRLNVLTSRWEGVSIAMLEAMARGVVPVVSDVVDLRDFVTPDTGVLLDENDIQGFADVIVHILDDDDEWRRLSANCRAMIRETSSKQAVCARWSQIFADISTRIAIPT